ncbi:MAG TPA: AAA family ATPase [Gemmatimonadales bacterium]|nr:AAA family ATPase [Gemmatimonadales bacterium]
MSDIVFTVFGQPALRPADSDGAAAPALGAKCLALLTFLILEPGPHSREQLAALLWGEHDDEAARASLRQALVQLRAAVGDALGVTRSSVGVERPIACDALKFLAAAERDPEAAVGYDATRFLEGLTIRHSPTFDDWAAETRRKLVARWTGAHGALARAAMERWDWRQAIAHAEAWLQAEPASEDGARLLVEAVYLSGDRAAALARFAAYRKRLLADEGIEPGRSILQLVRRIEADVSGRTPRPVTAERLGRLPSLQGPLVGRSAEMDVLARAWNAVRRGQGRVALVEGEAGVGKTRLVDELLRRVVAEGGLALRGRNDDAQAALPYGLVVQIVTQAMGAAGLGGTDPEWLAELSRLVPDLRRRFPGLPEATSATSADARRLSEAMSQMLLAVSSEQSVVIALDDLHWADAESCNLIHAVVRRLEQAPVLWCATLTLGELTRDAPAARLSRALRARPYAAAVTLSPLAEEDVWEMIRELGHIRLPTGGRRFAARLHDVTGGNPFYIIELLRTLFAQGWIAADTTSGEWLAAPADGGSSEMVMAPTVHDAIAERIESLPRDLYDLLITIALAGSGCRPDLLSHVHGISRLRAATMADGLVERYLVAEEDGAYRPAHPIISRVVSQGLTTSRRREVHRTIARALELLAASDLRTIAHGDIARHAELAGERALAYRHALAASDGANQRYAHEEALSWLDLAAACAAPGGESDVVNQRTADVLGRAGWGQVPALVRRPTPAGELERADLDLRVTSDK